MTQKRRGAPLGNQNALKHGYYAHTFSRAETRSKEGGPPPESLADEIALIRVLIRRVVEKTTGQESMAESLEILRIVSMAAASLARLHRAAGLVEVLVFPGAHEQTGGVGTAGNNERVHGELGAS